jgi:ribose 5-phosphate isomerase B
VGLRAQGGDQGAPSRSGYDVVDYGVGANEQADYPDVARMVARSIADGELDRAVLCCGTGIGMAIAANKVPGVRAGTAADPYSAERLAKSNDAQILCLGGRVIGPAVATILVDHFMASEFQGGASSRKIAKIDELDRARGMKPVLAD